MKLTIAIVSVALTLVMVTSDDAPAPPSCTVQEDYCKKYCADGGGSEEACKKVCSSDLEACKCIQEKQCANDVCVNSCYDSMKADYDCDVQRQTCIGFCKNQFAEDENCVEAHCKHQQEKCECFKAGNCDETKVNQPEPMPSCKVLQGRCLKNCRDGGGSDEECNTLCFADSEICNCVRKNNCGDQVANPTDFQKCIRQCQTNQKDTYNCDTYQKTCLGNCKNFFTNDNNCPISCSKSLEECKCIFLGQCPS